MPGPSTVTADWHTGHPRDLLLDCVAFGLPVCTRCLSPEAPDGWTPLCLSDDDEVDSRPGQDRCRGMTRCR